MQHERLTDDYWIADAASGSIVGQRTRRRFTIGDQVTVEIADVDIGARESNLRLAEDRKPGAKGHHLRVKPKSHAGKQPHKHPARKGHRKGRRRR